MAKAWQVNQTMSKIKSISQITIITKKANQPILSIESNPTAISFHFKQFQNNLATFLIYKMFIVNLYCSLGK